jgi:hypothetical protein
MRLTLCSSLFLGFLAVHLNADIVDAVATPTGLNSVQFSFTLNGFDLSLDQVLDIQFDSSVYASLSAPFAPANFSTMDFQPNPPTPGDFLVEALISNPALTPGSIGIDATLVPGHGELGPLPFFVYQFNSEGIREGSAVFSGMTTGTVPEPVGVSLPLLGLLGAGILGRRWRQRDNRRNRSRASA